MQLISLDRDSFENKKDWENICKTFNLSNETSEIYFYPKNIITRTSKALTWDNEDDS